MVRDGMGGEERGPGAISGTSDRPFPEVTSDCCRRPMHVHWTLDYPIFRSKVCPILLDLVSINIHVQVVSSPTASNTEKSKVHWTALIQFQI
jgi:hypothetical protein